jgi:hypothetical protein
MYHIIFSTDQYVPVHKSAYMYEPHFNWYMPFLARLSSSMLLLIKPRKVLICTVYHMWWIQVNPSEEIQEVLIACVQWNRKTRAKDIAEVYLPALQQKAVDLLDLIKKNLPDKTGEKAG